MCRHSIQLLTALIIFAAAPAFAAEKYALLIGVAKYEHSEMNQPQPLQYPEEDAKALGELLKSGGYTVELLLGKDATQVAIRAKLKGLQQQADADGVVLIGLFGHGVEVETPGADGQATTDGCFCPFDTAMQAAVTFQGKPLFGKDKQPLIEPDPATLIKLAELMQTLKLAKAGNRVVLADCCRTVPNAARGRSFGANFQVQDLPQNTSLLFGCSPNEQAFEHKDWGHGAFTKCLLEAIGELSADGAAVDTAQLASQIKKRVPALVASVSPRDKQTPKPFITDVVDLQLVLSQELAKTLTNTLGMQLTLIPSGEFLMGSPASEKDRSEDEGPQHRVRITQPFYMGVHEVTRGQFAAFVKAKNYQTDAEKDGKGGYGFDAKGEYEQKPEYTWRNGGLTQTDDHPVMNVSWNDAVAFCEWLSAKEGKAYRLPSEAQWEYACRAGTTTPFHFGSANDGTQANIDGTYPYGTETKGPYLKGTSRVGTYKANKFGLYDMHGNVYEWCADAYDEKVYASRSGVTSDPQVDASTVDRRVLRGGSWDSYAWGSRSADRVWSTPDDRLVNIGFRVSRTQ